MDNKLSIVCITYNQELFIKQALDSFLMQKTNFKYEIIISDDCSSDRTRDIIQDYVTKYPEIIKPILRDKNIGVIPNFIDTLSHAKSKYVVFCEGDDYWIDDNKLQKQVDFLEAHPEFSACFHPVKVIWENKKEKDSIYPTKKMMKKFILNSSHQPTFASNDGENNITSATYESGTQYKVITLQDLLKYNYIQTNSIVYRWEFIDKNIKDYVPEGILPGDWYLHLLHAKAGDIAYLPNIMAVYRRHENGIWYDEDSRIIKHGVKIICLYYSIWKNITKNSQDFWDNVAFPAIKAVISCLYKNKQMDKIIQIKEEFPEAYKQVFANCENQKTDVIYIKYKKYKKFCKIFLYTAIIQLIGILLLTYLLYIK